MAWYKPKDIIKKVSKSIKRGSKSVQKHVKVGTRSVAKTIAPAMPVVGAVLGTLALPGLGSVAGAALGTGLGTAMTYIGPETSRMESQRKTTLYVGAGTTALAGLGWATGLLAPAAVELGASTVAGAGVAGSASTVAGAGVGVPVSAAGSSFFGTVGTSLLSTAPLTAAQMLTSGSSTAATAAGSEANRSVSTGGIKTVTLPDGSEVSIPGSGSGGGGSVGAGETLGDILSNIGIGVGESLLAPGSPERSDDPVVSTTDQILTDYLRRAGMDTILKSGNPAPSEGAMNKADLLKAALVAGGAVLLVKMLG